MQVSAAVRNTCWHSQNWLPIYTVHVLKLHNYFIELYHIKGTFSVENFDEFDDFLQIRQSFACQLLVAAELAIKARPMYISPTAI